MQHWILTSCFFLLSYHVYCGSPILGWRDPKARFSRRFCYRALAFNNLKSEVLQALYIHFPKCVACTPDINKYITYSWNVGRLSSLIINLFNSYESLYKLARKIWFSNLHVENVSRKMVKNVFYWIWYRRYHCITSTTLTRNKGNQNGESISIA